MEKCPGSIGKNFINTSASAAIVPNPATTISRLAFGVWLLATSLPAFLEPATTSNIEMHDANHPNADEAEPTSVTGTKIESPRNNATNVPAPIARIEFPGV